MEGHQAADNDNSNKVTLIDQYVCWRTQPRVRAYVPYCTIDKIWEKCVHNHVFPIIQGMLNSKQHGFFNKHSTLSYLIEFYNDVYGVLDGGGQVDVIYLDFTKAFDCVIHNLLIAKVKTFSFYGSLLEWIKIT